MFILHLQRFEAMRSTKENGISGRVLFAIR
jgi:hypothetical protein